MKKLILILLLISTGVQAQRGAANDRIKALKTARITEALELSPSEAEKFWPVYNKHEEQIEQIKRQRRVDVMSITKGDMSTLNENEANAVMSKMTESFLHVQDRLDESCRSWSPLVGLYLAVAFLSLLAAAYDISLFMQGKVTYQIQTFVYYVDIFLVLSGLMFTGGFLMFGAMLTHRMNNLAVDCLVGMRSRGVPPNIAFSSFSFIASCI